MDREQAVEALQLLRRVVGQARDDTTLQNWGVIWMLHGFTNGLGFVGTNILMWRGYTTPWPYVMLWGVILPVNMTSIFLLKSRPAGAWTFFESMIWLIWTFVHRRRPRGHGRQLPARLPARAARPRRGRPLRVRVRVDGRDDGQALVPRLRPVRGGGGGDGRVPTLRVHPPGLAWGAVQFVAGATLHAQRKRRLASGTSPRLV
jgi:hypothetical protein